MSTKLHKELKENVIYKIGRYIDRVDGKEWVPLDISSFDIKTDADCEHAVRRIGEEQEYNQLIGLYIRRNGIEWFCRYR